MKFFLLSLSCIFYMTLLNAQENYYKMPNGKIVNETEYKTIKENLAEHGKIREVFLETETRNDSIIKTTKITVLQKDTFSPYAKFENQVGEHFPIEKFKDINGNFFNKDKLNGKPTLINFWFTRCPPCIEEKPNLKNLKERFGDSVNFIAITFEDKKRVDAFLLKNNIDFENITDAKLPIEELGVEAYPMKLILNKEGKIEEVHGDISSVEEFVEDSLRQLLQE